MLRKLTPPPPPSLNQWEEALSHFKGRIAAGEDVFGPLIRKFLLDNTHRVTLTMRPDPALGKKLEATEKERLAAKRATMDTDAVSPDSQLARRRPLIQSEEAP